MAIRRLTRDDLAIFHPIIQDAIPGLTNPDEAVRVFNSSVVIGDPDVPILVCLDREHVTDSGILASLPPVLAAFMRLANGNSIQISHFYPLPIREPGGIAKVAAALKLLASILREGSKRFPTISTWPVWAQFDPQLVSFMKNGLPSAGIAAPFPNSRTSGRFIWHARFSDAKQAVDSLAVDV